MNVTPFRGLQVEATCGCRIVRGYAESDFEKPIGEAVFNPCESHRENPAVVEVVHQLLNEALEKAAKDQKAAPQSSGPSHSSIADVAARNQAMQDGTPRRSPLKLATEGNRMVKVRTAASSDPDDPETPQPVRAQVGSQVPERPKVMVGSGHRPGSQPAARPLPSKSMGPSRPRGPQTANQVPPNATAGDLMLAEEGDLEIEI